MRRATRTILMLACAVTPAVAQSVSTRTLKICVESNAAPEVKQAAERIRDGVSNSPLLSILGVNGVSLVESGKLRGDRIEARALHHLILVGLPSDPLIADAWQREARGEPGGMYVFGFGHLRGTIGYVESDRNPYLHSQFIAVAPYETQVITITGSSPAGVALAADAFLNGGLVNGVVAAPGWTRPSPTILDHDPLAPDWVKPVLAPASAGSAQRIGVTQAGENEYRDVLGDTGLSPQSIWRVKYFEPGAWDGGLPLEASAPTEFHDGLHRRAIGNTLWVATFASASEASIAAAKIAEAAHMTQQNAGAQPAAWSGEAPAGNAVAMPKVTQSPWPLTLWTSGNVVLMSTVPQLTPRTMAK